MSWVNSYPKQHQALFHIEKELCLIFIFYPSPSPKDEIDYTP